MASAVWLEGDTCCSYVTTIKQASHFVCQVLVKLECHFSWQAQHLVKFTPHFSWQANIGEVQVSLFVEGAAFGEILNDSRGAKCSKEVSNIVHFRQYGESKSRWQADEIKVRRTKIQYAKIRRKKIHPRLEKSRTAVFFQCFFQWFVCQVSRKVGSLKRRARSHVMCYSDGLLGPVKQISLDAMKSEMELVESTRRR